MHAVRGDEHVFVEVETGRSDVTGNATKCAALKGTVVFVFTDARVSDEHRAGLQALLPAARLLTTADLRELP